MSLNDMFADMLKKAIPPEVAELLTKEKVETFVGQASAFVAEVRGRLGAIEDTQRLILQGMEELKNDNRSDSSGSNSKHASKRRSPAAADRSGNE